MRPEEFSGTAPAGRTGRLAVHGLAAALLVGGFVSASGAPDFYVAPGGNDTNPGTPSAPFATLARARDAVRQRIAAGLRKDILVRIRGGTYRQFDTLTFGPEDSGTSLFSITYAAAPGEKVELSGGRKITGWKKGTGEIWTAEVPEARSGRWAFRQLFVNGRRALRARTPNPDDQKPWWLIRGTSLTESETQPYTVSIDGPIIRYSHPERVELVSIYNNEGGRKRLQAVDVDQQKLIVAPPHRWNAKVFGNDWYLSAPTAGKPCYLENALEMLDRPGEWYLDVRTGVLSYWPRPGEDLAQAEVLAPVAQKTLLAAVGTRERPILNLKFQGIHIACVDWPLPAWGYSGLFSCNVATGPKDKPGHRFIEAAVEFEHARNCDFVNGVIEHVGGMALCLRDGTAFIRVEGNEIGDIGGGGIGAGGCNVAGGYLFAAPPPVPGEFKGYRIANNHVHDVGLDYHGGTGICLYLAQDSTVAHNLVHDTAYCGIIVAGSQDPNVPFAKNNRIEFNHIYNSMRTTVDGAGLYITFANYDRGTSVRGNLIHDTKWNAFGRGNVASGILDTIACHGLYLDGNNTGCQYQNNVVYRNAGGPLLFNSHASKNEWRDNLFQKEGTPPSEFLEAIQAFTGLEPDYQLRLLQVAPRDCKHYSLSDCSGDSRWSACQYDLPDCQRGVVQILRRSAGETEQAVLKLRGLRSSARYELAAYAGQLAKADKSFYEGTFFGTCDKDLFTTYLAALGNLPILSKVESVGLDGPPQRKGRELAETGVRVTLGPASGVLWVAYRRK